MKLALGAGAIALVPGFAYAQAVSSNVSSPSGRASEAGKEIHAVLTQFKVVTAANGSEKLEDASTVKPGDVIEYRVTYTNTSAKPVTGLVANLPIPDGLEYLPRTARPAADLLKVSTRDGVFASEPLTRRVAGKTESVPYVEYRQLRWTLGQLPASGVTAVSARAKVETVIPVVPKVAGIAAQGAPANGSGTFQAR